uniref:Uncharacterized protein n=1 Tax=Aegilops tauschii subsp. strangulata TaxID=200361 RepID=A0A453JXZ5_AEGTS
ALPPTHCHTLILLRRRSPPLQHRSPLPTTPCNLARLRRFKQLNYRLPFSATLSPSAFLSSLFSWPDFNKEILKPNQSASLLILQPCISLLNSGNPSLFHSSAFLFVFISLPFVVFTRLM